jgi:hypothetical protein
MLLRQRLNSLRSVQRHPSISADETHGKQESAPSNELVQHNPL